MDGYKQLNSYDRQLTIVKNSIRDINILARFVGK